MILCLLVGQMERQQHLAIGHTLKANQIKIIHNNEGANMAAGITSAFIMQISKETKIAIIEIDEGSIPRVLKKSHRQ